MTNSILHPKGRLRRQWNTMFLLSCVIALTLDPLFLYVPVINKDNKCLTFDKQLKIIAIAFRSLTDMIYVANIILQFISPYKNESLHGAGGNEVVTDAWLIAKRYLLSYFLMDMLAILPLPQVLIPNIFSERASSYFFNTRNFLNAVVFLQYVPRVLRIHLSRKILIGSGSKLIRNASVEAPYNLFLYVLASHVLGAFWYFFSIEQETACWQIACESHMGCTRSALRCEHSLGNYTFLNYYCPVSPPNITLFDFGIFLLALQSGIVSSTNFPQKLSYCFWWGLRNLSSFGQNLQTSTAFWENCFAFSIAISGMLLFLYFIGNLQIFLQFETSTWFENKKAKETMKAKERDIELWIERNLQPSPSTKQEIMSEIHRLLKEKKDVDVQNMLPYLPMGLGRNTKCHICLPLIRKVPQLQGPNGSQLQLMICDYLTPVHYNKHSYIVREGEPLDVMLFITQGIIWNFTTINGKGSVECIEGGSFYGEQLLDWGLEPSDVANLSNLPMSPKSLKTHTEVEAFALMASDLRTIVSSWRRHKAACVIQVAFRSRIRRVEEKKKSEMSSALLPKGNRSML